MKHLLLILTISLISLFATAAEPDITIGIVVPEQQEGIDGQAFKFLKTKLTSIMTQAGVSCIGGNIAMYPVVNITNEIVSEGGMQNLYKEYIDLTLNIGEYNTQTLFASTTLSLKGVGSRFKSQAIKNAFTNIRSNDPTIQKFIADAKEKIKDYYLTHRDAIIRKANSLAAMENYDEALALLYGYPSELKGADEVQRVMLNIYEKYAESNCSVLIQNARAAMSQQDYQTALSYLSQVDAQSPCGSQATSMMNSIHSQINAQQRRDEAREEREAQRAYNLQSQRINAVKNMVTAYYKRTWPKVTYNAVFVR